MFKIIKFSVTRNFVRNSCKNFYSQVCKFATENTEYDIRLSREHSELRIIQSSPKYQTFKSKENRIYQFDEETKSIANSDVLKGIQSLHWNDVSQESTNAEILMGFYNLQKYCAATNTELSSEMFDLFVDLLVSRANNFSINELMCALQTFSKFPMDKYSAQKRNYAEIIVALDEESSKKSVPLTLEQVLFLCSIWAEIPKAKKTYFARFAARQFNKYTKAMTAQQLTQALFYLNLLRRPLDDVRDFENVFEDNLDELELKEIAIICTTFMRLDKHFAKPEFRVKFLKTLCNRDLNEFIELEDHSIVSLLWVSDYLLFCLNKEFLFNFKCLPEPIEINEKSGRTLS